MAPRKPRKSTAKRTKKLTLNKKTLKDLEPRGDQVLGGGPTLVGACAHHTEKCIAVTQGCGGRTQNCLLHG
jgi:hypothetical protein